MEEIIDDINDISLLVERVQREFDIAPSVDGMMIADQAASNLTQSIGELYEKSALEREREEKIESLICKIEALTDKNIIINNSDDEKLLTKLNTSLMRLSKIMNI